MVVGVVVNVGWFGDYPNNVYMSFKIVIIVAQICTVEGLQNVKRYIIREDAMLCCFDAPHAMSYGRPALVV